ncbi:MAG TPA: hypothetical protein GXZ59_08360 [Clostridiaceae bacterium]|nr:hypothetical protein [Clostridiaceae bacterium]
MKNTKKHIYLLLVIILSFLFFAGCSDTAETETAFSYSEGIDNKGFWEKIKAMDYIDMFTYQGMEIPSDVHQMSGEDVQAEIDYILESYSTTEEITDRSIIDGDIVNIDYVGSVDGIKFDGGSTDGLGTEVTAGSMDYIDDFLVQIIGHTPGETIDVEVTFPDDYEEISLQGRDAIFVTTINHIVYTETPELTDEFVETNFSESNGWTTVAEMTEGIHDDLRTSALEEYVMDYMYYEVTVSSIPDVLMDYQVEAMQDYYQNSADDYGMELSAFLTEYVGVADMDELIESSQEANTNNVRYSLAIQAVAEAAGISVEEDDVVAYFEEYLGTSDYSAYEEELGLPYLKQLTLQQKVVDFIIENAVLL